MNEIHLHKHIYIIITHNNISAVDLLYIIQGIFMYHNWIIYTNTTVSVEGFFHK
jgi:hypothetical protein